MRIWCMCVKGYEMVTNNTLTTLQVILIYKYYILLL